jgi:cell division protein FtsW
MLGVTSFLVYFLSGNDRMHLIGSLALGLVSFIIVLFATIGAKYRMERISTFFNFWKTGNIPEPLSAGYQFKQILVAVASGGWFGLGFGQSKQKFLYLGDTAFSDTIFAIIAEEFGLIGCIFILSLFAFIFFRGFKIATKAPDKLGFLIAVSITIWITFQSILHIGANVALIPINGNTLPFLSYGGSSTIINLAAIGVLLNVASHAHNSNPFAVQSQMPSKDVIIHKRTRIKR